MLRFKLIGVSYQNATVHQNEDVDFLLEEDRWNDFGYCTTYHLHAGKRLTQGGTSYLGSISIMHHGQKDNCEYGIVGLNTFDASYFSSLSSEHVSLTGSIDLCLAVNKYLPQIDQRREFIQALRLITSTDDALYQEFKSEDCFQKSFLRSRTIEDVPLEQIRSYLFGEEVYYELMKCPVRFTLPNHESFEINYTRQDGTNSNLPSEIIAFIGDNGAGKSSILYRVVKLLYSDYTFRDRYTTLM